MVACPQPLTFVQASQFWMVTNPVRLYNPNVIAFGMQLPGPWGQQVPNVWNHVDLTPYGVPTDAKAAFLTGIMIITHGTSIEIAEVRAVFRKPGDTSADLTSYIAQDVEGHVGGGQRSHVALWVPLTSGAFEWAFYVLTGGMWPEHSAYGMNLSLQAYVK